jgi:uncharacterized membrane protein
MVGMEEGTPAAAKFFVGHRFGRSEMEVEQPGDVGGETSAAVVDPAGAGCVFPCLDGVVVGLVGAVVGALPLFPGSVIHHRSAA